MQERSFSEQTATSLQNHIIFDFEKTFGVADEFGRLSHAKSNTGAHFAMGLPVDCLLLRASDGPYLLRCQAGSGRFREWSGV